MKHGFIKVAAVTPKLRVADPKYNAGEIIGMMDEAAGEGAKIIVFPELCITGYTCGDLFLQEKLLSGAEEQLIRIAKHTEGMDTVAFVGLPYEYAGKLYNVAAALSGGKVLGFIPKTHLPNYNEFYERRHFTPGMQEPVEAHLAVSGDASGALEYTVPMGTHILFECTSMKGLSIGCEICEDLWAPDTPSTAAAMAGATIIANLSASDEITGKSIYRRQLVSMTSARLICGYIYTSAGTYESTQDVVYGGHDLIAENGNMLAESERFTDGIIYSEIDVRRLCEERRRMSTFDPANDKYLRVPFSLKETETALTREVDPRPFVPGDAATRDERCDEIFKIQAYGLAKRLIHIGCKNAVIGVSGGLDSTLALLVAVRAFKIAGLDTSGIIAVTMPGFGTTKRTHGNSVELAKALGATFKEVPIADAVRVHFRDIGQDESVHDVTYENGQARERTQILMDLANKCGGIVIGTGDMSELALGWATYNGDHMSMYGVNCGVPKTLVRHLVRYCADTSKDKRLSQVLYDVLDTPVSPELLPPEDGEISQKTEDLVGPYELHDFFLYHMLRTGASPARIYMLAKKAFNGTYEDEVILKWLKVFYKRFFAQQFKRSCLPDGPKVGSVAVSPRGDLRMPPDASAALWMSEIEEL